MTEYMNRNKKLGRDIRLVVGLGNPGSRYEGSRHNVGFEVLDILAVRYKFHFSEYRFSSLIGYGNIAGMDIIFAKPLTYMNRSGIAVNAIKTRHCLELNHALIVLDDVSLEQGRLRIRAKGSDGGHNGLKSVIKALCTDEIPRLRIGIGMPDPTRAMVTHVLDRFDKEEIPIISGALEDAADAVSFWVEHGIDQTMNKFNR